MLKGEAMNDNYGDQRGNSSLNVGQGNFKDANVHVGDVVNNAEHKYTPENTGLSRHLVIQNKILKRETLSTFSIISGLASIVGLYFSLFPFMNPTLKGNWSFLFIFILVVSTSAFLTSLFLKRHRFISFLFRRYYLELADNNGIFLTKISATCPMCSAKMNLRNIGPEKGYREDVLICSRNPNQHRIVLDPTVLPDIQE